MIQFYLRNLLVCLMLLLLGSQLKAADYYWVGGAGSWNEISHWSTTSGGPANQSIIPNLNDDVHFDGNSGLVNNSTVDLPTASPAYCRNMTWVGVTAAANFINRGQPLYIYGSVELAASVRYGTQGLNFVGSSAATLKINGAARYPATGWYNPIVVNKPGSSLTLLDGIPAALTVSVVNLTAGNLDMSDFTHIFADFAGNNANTRSLDISNATLTLNGTWDYRGTNNSINATNSVISAAVFHSDRFTFPKVDVTAASSSAMVINNTTFSQLTFTSPASISQTVRIGAGNTINRLEYKGGGSISGGGNTIKDLFIAPSNPGFSFVGNNTITGSLHASTPDCNALSQIFGYGTGATITFGPGAIVDVSNVYMSNLAAAGSITLPIPVTGADGGGNTGWAFQPRATGTTLYWVGGAGAWNDNSHWAASSGGSGGYCVPFTGDNVVFDANSGFTAASKTVSLTSTAWCHNMTWTSVTAAPVLALGANQLQVYGSIALDPTQTLNRSTGFILFTGAEAATLTTNGCANANISMQVSKTDVNSGLTLMDDINSPGLALTITQGKILMANRSMNLYSFLSVGGLARTVDITNSTITLEQEWNANATSTTWVNNGAGSFIIAKNRFLTNGLTYPKVHCYGAGNNFAIANATIQELLFTNTTLSPNYYALDGNNNIGTLEFKGAGQIRGNNTINNLLLAPSRNYYFAGTQTINGLFRYNNPDCSGLGELRSVAGIATVSFGASSTKDIRNVMLQNMRATGTGVPVAVTGADAGGNTGFTFTSSDSGPRYWVGGSGDWNESAHWSTTSGGPGGACIPTVANDVFFDANSFSSGSSTVTINQGNTYCKNMSWAGAAFAPVFNKNASLNLEIWGDLVMNPVVTMNARVIFTGSANSTLTPNGSTLGDFDIYVLKPTGSTLTFAGDFSNTRTRLELRSGGLDLNGRTIVMEALSDEIVAVPTSLNITNANINAAWLYSGAAKSLQAGGSTIVAGYFAVNGGTYNQVNVTANRADYIGISNTAISSLLFSNTSPASGAEIGGSNTFGTLEFKGKGYIGGTGNTIGTLIFAPGQTYTFLAGSNNTITGDWFGSGTPCNPTQIVSSSTTNATITKTTGTVDLDYIRLNRITAAGITPFKAREHSIDLGGNVNWDITPYDNSATITGLGPDRTICAEAFPVVLNTDGFFAGPSASYAWTGGSTGKTLSITEGGTYSVTVQYPDGCSISDQIVITKSTVTVAPLTGTTTVCAGLTTALQSTTAGGVWSTSDAAIATVNPGTGLVTGIAAGTATITYMVTNGSGCSASQLATVTVNALPVVNAITGTLSLFEGGTTALSSTSPGGTWSSSNTAVATVDGSGVVTGVSGGTADITYSVTNANGCTATRTATVTVDGFSPAKRELSIVKTGDAQEPSGNGGFSISLPSGVLASENINITYTIGGTATAPADYTPLSGTAVILAGQNSVALPVTVTNDGVIENTETILVTLNGATSTNYAYTVSTTNGNASVAIADDDNTAANRELTVAGTVITEGAAPIAIRISIAGGNVASENIDVSYTLSGTAGNGLDYNTLSGSIILPTGQAYVDLQVTAIDDKIIEGTENLIVTLTGGTTATIGNFTPSTTQGSMDVPVNDNDNTAANRTLSVTAGGNAAEPAANSSFTISLPATITVTEPLTVNYTISGTAVNGTDYTSIANTAVIAAGQNNVVVPVTVTDDGLVEAVETVILTINNGTSPSFAFTASPTAGNGTVNITDDDNTTANREVRIIKTGDAAEPATAGAFHISLPTGVLASEDITVTYSVGGTATPGADYTALTGTITIAAGTNGITLPVAVIDNSVVEPTETIALSLSAAMSASLTYTIPAGGGNATVNISDNDHTANSNIVLLTKVSDAIEGGTNGQYRVSLPSGVTSSEDVVITFSLGGDATNSVDYNILGLSGANIVIPAGANEVLIDVDASNDGIIEGPENVQITLASAASASYPFTIDPSGNGGAVNIVDANAASSTPLQVITGTNASEPGTGGTFTVKLAGVATSAWPITVGYRVSGIAQPGVDYVAPSTIVIPANTNAVTVNLNIQDDQIIEPTETVIITLLSGSAKDGGNAFIFPPDPANDDITVNIADDDAVLAANRILSVTKNTDAAEPSSGGSYAISLPAGYSSSADITLYYTMSGTATSNTDYTVSTIKLPAYSNSVVIPLSVADDKIIENTETAILTLNAGTAGVDGNFSYAPSPVSSSANLDITDDDNTAANRMLSAVATTNAAEGGSAGSFSIKLPDGITATDPISVIYTVAGSATSGVDYAALTGTATIAVGQNSVPVTLTAINDQVIEQTETVALTITSVTGTGGAYTPATGSETASLNITDNDNTLANRTLKIVRTAHAAESGTDGTFSIGFNANTSILSSEDITVNYTIAGIATPGVDYTTLSGSVVLPAGQNSVPLNVQAVNDQLIEYPETVIVTLTSGTSASFNFPATATPADKTATVNITDDDNIPANRLLSVTNTADAAEPGTNGNFRFSLPPNIISSVAVTVSYLTNGSTATSGADYTLGAAVIPAGQNYVDVPVNVVNDNLIEHTETVIVTVVGASSSFAFTPSPTASSATVNISDEDNTPTSRHVTASLAYEGTEGAAGTAGRIRFNYGLGAIPSETVTINYTVSGSAVLGTDFNGSPTATQFSGTTQLTAMGTGGTVSIGAVVDDAIIEGTEEVVITITSVTSPNFSYTFGPPATARIFDNDSTPANLELAVTKTADAVESGAAGEFTISLPGTTTTATEDITVNYTIAGTATNGTDYANLIGTVVIPAGNHAVKVPVSAAIDQLIETTETVTMTIISGASARFSFTPNVANGSATVNITDADNTPINMGLSITKVNDASEPSALGLVTFALPAGITAAQNIAVSYTVSGTATEDVDYAKLSGTATILAGRSSVTIPVSAIDDQVIEPLETVAISLTGGSSPGHVYTGSGNVTVNISDDESLPANLLLSISKDADAAEPNTPGSFIIALPANVTATEDITVSYAASGTATNGIDYSNLGGSAIIPAGSNSISVPVNVVDDQQIEGIETVIISLTGGSSSNFAFAGTGSVTLDIADDDNTPENLALSILKTTDAREPGTNGSFVISLPAGVTATEDINVNYTISGTATADSDYTALTGTLTIPANQNSVNVPVTVLNDNIIEPTETITGTLSGGSSASLIFTGSGSAVLNINDDESSVPANLVLGISKGADGAESGSNVSFTVSLQPGLTAAADITVNYTVTGTATPGADCAALAGSVTIPAGQNSVTVPVTVTDDQIIEATESLTLTLVGGSSGGLTFTGTGSATANITDNDSNAGNLILSIVKTADAAEPATNGSFSISLPAGLTAGEDITASYTVSGTATATADYTPLTGSAVIPTGQNAVIIPLMVTDDNVAEVTETLSLTLTGGTSASLSFAASGTSATATADLSDDDKRAQVITFTPLPVKTFGDPAFTLNATGGASGNPIVYTSANPAVATISGNTVTIVGAGTTTITASQAGNAGYHAAADVSQVLTVMPRPNVAPTLAAIDDQQLCYTTNTQTLALSGITAGIESEQTITLSVSSNNPDLFSSLTVTPGTTGNASVNYTIKNRAGGTALITVTVKDDGGTLHGGSDTFSRSFTLLVSALPELHIAADPGTNVSKGQTITLTASGASSYSWANAAGILGGQNSATLTVRPAQTTTYTVTGTSAAGCTSTQEITITVIEDYNLVANNVLTPNGDGKNDFFTVQNIDMYPNNEVRIFDRAGRSVYSKRGYNNEWDGTLNGSPLDEDTYYYIIDFGNGVKAKRGFISIVRKY